MQWPPVHPFRPGAEARAAADVTILKVSRNTLKNFSYLVVDRGTQSAVLIDPAWEMDKIAKEIANRGVTLGAVLVTHAHPDHTDLAANFAEQHGCPVWASADAIAHLPLMQECAQAVDGGHLHVGKMLIRPILTPGHTSGCTCYLIGDSLFSGDTLFAEGCGMCPGVAAAHDMFRSLEMLKSRLEPTTRIFPGHSYGIPTGQSFSTLLRENVYLQFHSKETFTAFRLRSGQNLARMFQFS